MMSFTCINIKRLLHMMVLILMTTIPPALTFESQGYMIKEAYYVPQNEQEYKELTQNITCLPPNLKVTYLINMFKTRTIIGCFPDEKIYGGYCAELNNGSELRVQPNYAAPCHNFTHTPCKNLYYSSQSYLIRQCFEEYGNISSPLELFRENENLQTIKNDQKEVIQKQSYSLSEEIRKNAKLMKTIKELNIKIMELREKMNENVQNEEQCENACLAIAFILLVLLTFVILGNIFLFVLHRHKFGDRITWREFFCRRWILIKAWFSTSDKQKQLLRPLLPATTERGTDAETVESSQGISNIGSREHTERIDLQNEKEVMSKGGKVSDDNHEEHDSAAEYERLLSENVEQRDRHDVHPERIPSVEENPKITEGVPETGQNIKACVEDTEPQKPITSSPSIERIIDSIDFSYDNM